jgi:hypothetical protein
MLAYAMVAPTLPAPMIPIFDIFSAIRFAA